MITPQQIDQIAFSKATFGGYNMQQVDEILEPLTEDYVALYKENALLKSKMRVLVGKLEEYRKNEASVKEAAASAKKACDKMVAEAEAKAAALIQKAQAEAQAAAQAAPVVAAPAVSGAETEALVAAEEAKLAEARKLTSSRINEIQDQMRSCIQALDRIKANNPVPAEEQEAPKASKPADEAPAVKAAAPAADFFNSNSVADEISQSLEALVGTTQDVAPKAPPKHPTHDATTSRFTNLNLQFGRNYHSNH